MTTQIGDEIIIMSQDQHQPVRKGEIRGVINERGGILYLVRWSDTGDESLLQSGPNVTIKHRHGPGNEAVAVVADSQFSRLRHPLAWRHSRDREQMTKRWEVCVAWRVHHIIAGLGLTYVENSIGGGKILHVPEVVSVTAGPPVALEIKILPGQSPEDFAAHERTFVWNLDTFANLDVAKVRIVSLGLDRIQLELLSHDPQPGHPSARR